MCGISGIINKNNSLVAKDKIQNINDLIAHRGPDDAGFHFGANFAFGHRRLAILDLSGDGHQPMNYLEIKEELLQAGYTLDFTKLDLTQKWKLFNIAKWEEIYNVKI